jgi:hypothetical protein
MRMHTTMGHWQEEIEGRSFTVSILYMATLGTSSVCSQSLFSFDLISLRRPSRLCRLVANGRPWEYCPPSTKFLSKSELEPLFEPHRCLMAIRVLPVERGGRARLGNQGTPTNITVSAEVSPPLNDDHRDRVQQ